MTDGTGTDGTGTDGTGTGSAGTERGVASEATASGDELVAGIRVVAGSPSPEELAAVVAVLQAQAEAAAAAGRAAIEQSPRSGWDASARGLRRPLSHGPGAWERSLR